MPCKRYDDRKLLVQNHYLSALLRHIVVNCSSAQREVVGGDPLLQLHITILETEPFCRIDMH